MQLTLKNLAFGAALLAAAALMPRSGTAQSLFSPAISVNDSVISYYELEQRARFLQLLRAPGDPEVLARTQLVEDRLKQAAIAEVGIEVSPEQVETGMEEFAARADLSREEFLEALGQGGVSAETFRDFVTIGIAWRDYVRGRFLNQARPSNAEIDRALGQDGSGGGVRVLLSEIIIPVNEQNAAEVEALSQDLAQITTTAAFSQAAERFSATETRTRGGRLDWLPINELPPVLRPVILSLSPGEVSPPVQVPNAIALFQLRDIQETTSGAPQFSAIDYVVYYIAGGRTPEALSVAAGIAARVDACDDFYGIARDQPPEVLERVSLSPAEIPRDIAQELAKLDPGEISTALTRSGGQTLVMLMLCGRTARLNEDATREEVANALTAQRLNAFAEGYLQQLEADALIVER